VKVGVGTGWHQGVDQCTETASIPGSLSERASQPAVKFGQLLATDDDIEVMQYAVPRTGNVPLVYRERQKAQKPITCDLVIILFFHGSSLLKSYVFSRYCVFQS